MSWKISRIEISSFKAFKHIHMDFGSSSLLTLDGPNGYGKTSIFDALELVLTGQIKRIQDLFSTLMTANRKNYDDSLFWNTRSGKKDLFIKIEFISAEHRLVLARHAPIKLLETKANNRADKFEHFSLHELSDFDSEDFTDASRRDNHFLDRVFGANFRENFSLLNYLEQGQNRLLHTRVDERKDALGNLFNTSDVAAEIDSCRAVAARLTKLSGDQSRKTKENDLEAECTALREMVQADLGGVSYKRLSTIEQGAGWDKENPFPTYDKNIHTHYNEYLRKLSELLPLKAVISVRARNDQIEADIELHVEVLSDLAKFGNDIGKLDSLDIIRKEINQLSKAASIIRKGASTITAEQARTLPNWASGSLELFEIQIGNRDELQKRNTVNESFAAELALLKQQLLDEHSKLYPDDKDCPLCGIGWESHASMLHAIEQRAGRIAETLGVDGRNLIALTTSMTGALAAVDAYIQSRVATLQSVYNQSLHKALSEIRTRLLSVQQLRERLSTEGIPIPFTYNDDEVVVAARLEELRSSMRAKKTAETMMIPEDWRQIIDVSFKELQDFYILEAQDLIDKDLYIKLKANEAQNGRLQQCQNELQAIKRENDAYAKAKDKVNKLRATLEKAEQKYADQTISEIELIFHIYSGRLIQNYQRGLGLFIESKDGKQLRFLTAEQSDHDAVMSMSSGQVAALSLAFFLSLNKVYADLPLILIDDPSQSLDDVNIASLTDLLRCELKHCQLIVSSHEEDISNYMRYRFDRAGLSTASLNMQRLAKESP